MVVIQVDKVYAFEDPKPIIEINIVGGLGVTATINNTGNLDAEDITWEIDVKGGILGMINKTVTGTTDIFTGKSVEISTGIFIGFGGIDIKVSAADEEEVIEGIQILFLTMIN